MSGKTSGSLQVVERRIRRHRHDARGVARDLRGEPLDVLTRRQTDHSKPIRMRIHHGQRALTDGTRGAEDGKPLHLVIL